MLNISPNSINSTFPKDRFKSFEIVKNKKSNKVLRRLLYTLFGLTVLILFLPWTQNIQSNGRITTLKPDQRPQTIHSVIAGRIEKWFVQEGDFVHKGDTVLFISEIKDEYFDPQLLSRTEDQLTSKENSVQAYMDKVKALDNQIDALSQTSKLKLEQTQNKLKQAKLKVTSDSIDYEAAKINKAIADEQLKRMESLYESGLKSLTDLESKRSAYQNANSNMISAENKLLTSKNEVINAKVEITSIQAQYRDYLAKSESEKQSTLSNMYDAEAVVTKLQNQYMNYSVRTGMYYITAPQDGYITKALQSGLGETIKEGEDLVSIMPSKYDLAVEMYVDPIDLPLVDIGQHVRIQFDGWPAIVFSGWPNVSYGTYGGEVFAIDNFISENGKFRILVSPDPNDHPWPDALRVGGGTKTMLLLKDVSVGYELWRKINGFPPDFYKSEKTDEKKDKNSDSK